MIVKLQTSRRFVPSSYVGAGSIGGRARSSIDTISASWSRGRGRGRGAETGDTQSVRAEPGGEQRLLCHTGAHYTTLHTRLEPWQPLDIDKIGKVSSALFYIMSRSLGLPRFIEQPQ